MMLPVVTAAPTASPGCSAAERGEIAYLVYCSADNKIYIWIDNSWRSIAAL